MTYICPVCGYDKLTEPAYDIHNCPSYEICASCGTEFGFDDFTDSILSLRQKWIKNGMQFWNTSAKSDDWNPLLQLKNIKLRGLEKIYLLLPRHFNGQIISYDYTFHSCTDPRMVEYLLEDMDYYLYILLGGKEDTKTYPPKKPTIYELEKLIKKILPYFSSMLEKQKITSILKETHSLIQKI